MLDDAADRLGNIEHRVRHWAQASQRSPQGHLVNKVKDRWFGDREPFRRGPGQRESTGIVHVDNSSKIRRQWLSDLVPMQAH